MERSGRLRNYPAVVGAIGLIALAVVAAASLHDGLTAPTPAQAATISIDVGNNWFCQSSFQNGTCTTNIAVGDTVEWQFTTSRTHTTTSTSPSKWDSGNRTGPGAVFSHTFNQAGVYAYRCDIHPSSMQGEIIVGSPPTATDTPLPPTATDTPLPPTATNTAPPPTATNTPAPPTATNTSGPPTATNTPTNTPGPPTATPQATNTPAATSTPGTPTATQPQAPTATAQGTPAPETPTATAQATPSATVQPATATPSDPAATSTNTPAPTATASPTPAASVDAGDVDCGGAVTAVDAALILQRVAALLAALPCPQNGDVNRDGGIDAIDATLVLQHTAGLIGNLPIGSPSGRPLRTW